MLELEEVLSRLRRAPDDQESWTELFRQTWSFVSALARRQLPPPRRLLDADDLVQEVYLRFVRYWRERRPAIEESRTLLALLSVITRRLAGDLRRYTHRARRDVERDAPEAVDQATARTDRQQHLELRDLLDRVRLQLDDDERAILDLRLQGYAHQEIADRLGVAVRTVERRVQRIRQVLAPHVELENTKPLE